MTIRGKWVSFAVGSLAVLACQASATMPRSTAMTLGPTSEPTAVVASTSPIASVRPTAYVEPSGIPALIPPYELDTPGQTQFVGSVIVGSMEGTRLSMSSHLYPQNAPVQVLTNAVVEAQLIYSGRGDHYIYGALWGSPLAGDQVRVTIYRVEDGTLSLHATKAERVDVGAIGFKGDLPAFETPGRYRVEVTTPDGIVLAWVVLDVAPQCQDTEPCSGG